MTTRPLRPQGAGEDMRAMKSSNLRRYLRAMANQPRSDSMPFHTPPSAEVAGYAGFALFEALSDLLIMKDGLTRNEVDELLARTAARLQTYPNEAGRRTADFVRQLGEQ
jgi:hypothetical protein